MLVYPAIDLRDGRCVRLRQGDYAQETVFGDDPAAMARRWVDQGAEVLHLVDLDGAKEGHPVNGESVRRIVEAVHVPCQLGGGLRTEEDVREVLGWGVDRVVLGTKAVQDPDWLGDLARQYPERIVLGIDARDGMVATDGWLNVSSCSALDLARRCENFPLAALVYTDISRDGMMKGPNVEAMGQMARHVSLPVIASGGVTEQDHIRQLKERGLFGCIIGRALYEGHLDLTAVLEMARPES